jgi:hypothetical protein
MTYRRRTTDSTARKVGNRRAVPRYSPGGQVQVEPGKFCVYNQTRERFLGSEVDAADFSAASLADRIHKLSADTGEGLWLVPFKGISPASVRVPLDLIYLDEDQIVIDVVEAFPISHISPSRPPAASVLVLPSHTINSTHTEPGDQLVLCPPAEMKRLLEQPPAAVENDADDEQTAAPVLEELSPAGSGRLLQWKDASRQESVREEPSAPESPSADIPAQAPSAPVQSVAPQSEQLQSEQPESAQAQPAQPQSNPAEQSEPAPDTVKQAKSWFKRLFWPDPVEPRKASRESLPGLAAYFWTGGVPQQHDIRDVSPTGLYVLTEERWFPGTVVRMTLTDSRTTDPNCSITANTMVVRWGNDGVGLQFVLQDAKDMRRGPVQLDHMAGNVDSRQLDQFLHRFKHARN